MTKIKTTTPDFGNPAHRSLAGRGVHLPARTSACGIPAHAGRCCTESRNRQHRHRRDHPAKPLRSPQRLPNSPAVDQPTQTPWVITATTDPAQQANVAVVVPVMPTATKKPATSGGAVWPTIHPHLLHRRSPHQQSATRQLLRFLPRIRF